MVETSSNHLLLQCTVKPSSSHLNSASPETVVVQLLSLTLCDPLDCSVPGSSVLHYLPEFAQSHVCWVGDDIQPSHPLLLPSSSALHLSQHQGLFQWVDSSHQVTKYWSFRICSSKEYSGLISIRIDWFDFLAVQETLRSLIQHHNLKVSVLQCSAFFMVQLSYLNMTTGQTIALSTWTFVSNVMSLFF